jgi:hypothetical protein
MKNLTHEKLWSELYDCVAAKIDGEQLCFPAEFDQHGDQIHLEVNDGNHSLLIDRNSPVECHEIMDGVFEIIALDEMGKPQKYEIQPLFGK